MRQVHTVNYPRRHKVELDMIMSLTLVREEVVAVKGAPLSPALGSAEDMASPEPDSGSLCGGF